MKVVSRWVTNVVPAVALCALALGAGLLWPVAPTSATTGTSVPPGNLVGNVTWTLVLTDSRLLDLTSLALTNPAGSGQITATSGTVTTNASVTIQDAPLELSTLQLAAPSTAVTNESFEVTVTARDQYGDVLVPPVGGMTVSLSATGAVTVPSVIVMTSGVETFTATAGAAAGTGHITATSGTVTTNASVTILVPDVVTATIDAAWPNPVLANESVSFAGHATDSRGDAVTGYEWREGATVLSTDAAFKMSALSVGAHTISFRARCANGVWSAETTVVVTVVRVPCSLSAPSVTGKATARKGTALKGTITPGHAGRVTLEVKVLSKKKYKAYKRYTTTSKATGGWTYKARLKKGTYRIRALTADGPIYSAGASKWRKVVVK